MRSADTILEALASRRLIPPLSAGDPSLDEAGAYAIAAEVHERRLERGEKAAGRKIGFTNRTIWAAFDVWAPIWAYVYDSTVRHASDGTVRFAIEGLLQPQLEPEIQLHFARTPPVTQDENEILRCIDWIAHGFEIVQCPYPDWKFKGVDTIAACGLHAALVVGAPVAVRDIDDCVAKLRAFTITLSRNGESVAAGGGANVLDSPLLSFAHLAEVLARQSSAVPVQAGEIVTTGTLTMPFPIVPGETWTTKLEGINLPGLSVTLV